MSKEEAIKALAEKLIEIAPDVLADDRKKVIAALGVSYMSVQRYLRGQGKNPALGIRIYKSLTKCITERETLLIESDIAK